MERLTLPENAATSLGRRAFFKGALGLGLGVFAASLVACESTQPSHKAESPPLRFFTEHEKEVLIKDGAVVYPVGDETIRQQKEHHPAVEDFLDLNDITDKNLFFWDLAPRKIDVAFYPDIDRFFVLGSFGANKAEQERLLTVDANALRARLGLQNIAEVLLQAPEVTGLLFKHRDATGKRLSGLNEPRIIRTDTRYASTGIGILDRLLSRLGVPVFVDVWLFYGELGLILNKSPDSYGSSKLGAARFIVATGVLN